MDSNFPLTGKHILLGVSGSIAAYKIIDLASKLTQLGALVDVIMTKAALKFVQPLAFQAVTGRTVYTDLWQTEVSGLPTHIAHVGLGEAADAYIVTPATANTIAKLANGHADNLLTITAQAVRCPILLAPAMDGAMYEHDATQTNLAQLQDRGVYVIEPDTGRFASGLVGRGRLPETPTLLGHLRYVLGSNQALHEHKVIITAGGTRESLDPVRYLTNHSSGKQGYSIAQAAIDFGATVTLITSTRGLAEPIGANVIRVNTAQEMHDAVLEEIQDATALIMAAAVADFRPGTQSESKIKKNTVDNELQLQLSPNPDVLLNVKEYQEQHGKPDLMIGFAAESHDVVDNARAKVVRKGLDLLIANDITAIDAGFAVDNNRVVVIDSDGSHEELPLQSKYAVGRLIMTYIQETISS